MRAGRIMAGVLLVVVGLGLGLGIARLRSPAERPPPAVTSAPDDGDPDALTELPPPGELLAPADATGPERAVAGYLTAEARGDFAASYEFLSTADRESFPTPAVWTEAHADFARVTGFVVQDVLPAGDRATVVTLTGFEAGLDEVLGLTPARARSTWEAVGEGGVWRVRLDRSSAEPLYPSDAAAAGVARRWAEARLRCTSAADLEHHTIGLPALAQRLCGADGDLSLGPVGPLAETDGVSALVSAYGPEVMDWGRAVAVESPEPMQIVLAPVGAEWRVIGVTRAGFSG